MCEVGKKMGCCRQQPKSGRTLKKRSQRDGKLTDANLLGAFAGFNEAAPILGG
jgi:hypothetical protein